MSWYKWNEIAKGFAEYVEQFRLVLQRGAVSIQLYYDEVPEDEESLLVVGIFGNDNSESDVTRVEIDLVRKALGDTELFELGFGTSTDNATWAMLIGEKKNALTTVVGKNFRKEMLKIFLEDAVWRCWREAAGEPVPAEVESEGWTSAFSALE